MRILLVVHGFPPAAQGGTEIYAGLHARTLRDRFGDDVFVLTREQDPSRPELATRVQTDARGVVRTAWINNTFRRARSFAETYANPAIDAVAAGLIDEFDPDVAHIHHLTCLSTGIVRHLVDRRVPVFMTLHDYWLLCHRGQLLDELFRVCKGPEPSGCENCLGAAAGIGLAGYAGAASLRSAGAHLPPMVSRRLIGGARWVSQRLASRRRIEVEAGRRLSHMREVCGAVSQFFAPSNDIGRRFVEFGIPPGKIRTAPYGIEPLAGAVVRQPSNRLRIGFAGSLMISKAPHVLIEAFQRLPRDSATLEIVGGYAAYHGDDRYWRELATYTGDRRIRFRGAVPHERMGEVFSAIDVLVVPSIWPETSPIVIREALAAGVPVVGSRIGGIPEAIADGVNGMLFNPGDATDLHRVLSRLIAEPRLLETLRQGTGQGRTIDEDVAFTRGHYAGAASAGGSGRTSKPILPTPAPAHAQTVAIVLSYGAPDEAILAARSLQVSKSPLRIIIVDNGSNAATGQVLAALGDDITVIQTGGNLGFSGGMNVGIREALGAGATHLFLVNSDMIVPPDCVGHLHEALEATGAGIAGPAVLSRSMPDRIGTLGISYRPSTGRMRQQSFGAHVSSMDVPATTTVDAICGCAMLVKREVVNAIGLLDEEYFFSFEDLDWCFRARRAGFESVLAARAIAYHEGGSTGDESPRRLYYAARNHLRFAQRETKGGQAGLSSWWRGTSIVALNMAHAVRARGGSLPARLAAVARGTRDHFAKRYGEKRT